MFFTLGIDWGHKRIGLALGDPNSGLILPYKIIQNYSDQFLGSRKNNLFKSVWVEIADILKVKKIQIVVIGRPTNFYLENTDTTDKVDNFVNQFKLNFPEVKVVTINEKSTSKEAMEKLGSQASQNKSLDAQAASQILEIYYNYHQQNNI